MGFEVQLRQLYVYDNSRYENRDQGNRRTDGGPDYTPAEQLK